MADTLNKLVKDLQNNYRTLQKKFYSDNNLLDLKLSLIKNNLNSTFRNGIESEKFLEILNNEVINSIIFDMVLHDYVVINIGINTLKSLLNHNNEKSKNKSYVVELSELKKEIFSLVSFYFTKEEVIIFFEYSDNEGRMIIKPKEYVNIDRPNIKFIKFPFYNYKLIDDIKEKHLKK